MADEKRVATRKPHQLALKNREQLTVEGVLNVDSFDNQEILIETDAGLLLVRGDDLHIKELNLEGGNLALTGFVRALEYASDGAGRKARGLLGRLFR